MRSYPVCPKSEAPKAVSRLCGEGKKGGAEEGDLPMSSAACISLGPTPLSHLKNAEKGASLSLASVRGAGFRPSPGAPLFLRIPSRPSRRKPSPRRTSVRRFSPVMEWQDCSSEIEVDVPCSVAYDCYSDRQMIPKWMPFISSVKVLQDKPDLSRWALKYEVFGRDVEFSWLARNLQPIPNQKIHWRSLEGLPNRFNFPIIVNLFWFSLRDYGCSDQIHTEDYRHTLVILENYTFMSFPQFMSRGAVRFFPKSPSSCRIQLTVSYEIPEILIPVASALKPFLEGLLAQGLERFAKVAKEYQRKIPQR
ncbi:Polyketide cyclase / dehydrase and lipid transport [Musa troglodytarum]|uniref:Polyketide cyclase / dehydrase and lipid transport n=1 Tax=Musa troglodytarum TaxID=320322 RepID=A0A9E7FTC2_9LILI|nr:Polyketide cyclase / dehydrase and lipid transport [Musa troglodytarum]